MILTASSTISVANSMLMQALLAFEPADKHRTKLSMKSNVAASGTTPTPLRASSPPFGAAHFFTVEVTFFTSARYNFADSFATFLEADDKFACSQRRCAAKTRLVSW